MVKRLKKRGTVSAPPASGSPAALAGQAPVRREHSRKAAASHEPVRLRREADRTGGRRAPDSAFYQFMHSTYCDIEMFFRSIAQENSTSYFFFGDMRRNVFYISDNMRDDFGFGSNIVPALLRDWEQRIPTPRDRERYRQELESMLRDRRVLHNLQHRVRTVDGRDVWIHCSGMMKWSEDGQTPLFFSGRVTHQDEHFVIDPVSNLPREGLLFQNLDEAQKSGLPVRAIGFSLNNILEINSARGRAFSDSLIRSIARELVERLSDRMSFYRIEGMRFLALVDPACTAEREELVRRIRDIVSSRYRKSGIALQPPCSFALWEEVPCGISLEDFLERTITLIRTARQENRLEVMEYSEPDLERGRRLSAMIMALSRDVQKDMENFRIVVQPIVSCTTGTMVGGETLLRWRYQGQDVSPAVFVPLLEKDSMIHLVGRWVLDQAAAACRRMNAGGANLYLSFNVSLHQMADESFPEAVAEVLDKYRLNGTQLVAEVTESCMDTDAESLRRFMDVCRERGVRIALDDFGSGYASFRMLLQYPTDIVKIDQSILQEMMKSDKKMDFISSIVYACHRFGKKVCMEGVETREQSELIRESGCDFIQGFYYHRPLELDEIP